MRTPLHGWTKHGLPVHQHVMDHHPTDTAYQRANKAVALWLTKNVGTMTCFWLFVVLALVSLPATLVAAGVLQTGEFLPAQVASVGLILIVQWTAQSFIQLVLLPSIMVGQQLQNAASDARAGKQFDDTETIVDRLDTATAGGITEILDAVNRIEQRMPRAPQGRKNP